jgi:hypothetical protein
MPSVLDKKVVKNISNTLLKFQKRWSSDVPTR